MTRLFLAAGVAALAITAPAASAPGDMRGKDRSAQTQKAERGGKARAQRTERRQAVEKRSGARAQRIRATQATERRLAARNRANIREQRVERVNRVRDRARPVERRAEANQRVLDRGDRLVVRAPEIRDRRLVRVNDRREARTERLAQRIAQRDVLRVRDWDDAVRGGIWINGCPPGLAKKPVACVPPGQVNNVVGQPLSVLSDRVTLRNVPDRLRVVYADTPNHYYRYGNGYMYRVNRETNLISALLPLFGLGLTAGQPFPTAYSGYYMPAGLQPFYANSGACGYSPYRDDYYRYANGYVYEIDCRTGLIEDVDPLLGYGYGYGQMMPATYSAYNIPYQYRPLYADTSNAYYRYAPGAIYQVDPTTSLITAVAALLTGGMTVGQPLPMGYSTYNVPMAYRANYYDTPNSWYRYSNGYIYQVDPATQLVTAIVASALT